jgi:diguanylate cyclase (GGDEF)-like protein
LGNEIFASQIMAIKATMAEIMKRKSLLLITVYDEHGKVLASTDKDTQKDLSSEEIAALQLTFMSTKKSWNSQSVLDFTSPITAYGENVGFWKIYYSLASLEQETLEIIFIFATLIFSIAMLIVILLNSILVRIVLTPLYTLRNTMQHIEGIGREPGSGSKRLDKMVQEFDSFSEDLVPVKETNNEIVLLAWSFQQMLFALKNAYVGIHTDGLTQLNNRLRLDEALEYEIDQIQKDGRTFSIILLDIDHFKKVNDTYGHLAGDEVLKKLADVLQKNFRAIDIPGRWGGDEFLVLLPQLDKRQACKIVERVRMGIEITEFPYVGGITCSFGVAEYTAKGTIKDLIAKADKALYMAKAGGRNRVENV